MFHSKTEAFRMASYDFIQLPPNTNEVQSSMTDASWCNINDPETNVIGQEGHAFNSEDPDAQRFTQTRRVNVPTGDSYGRPTYQERQEVTEVINICGYHWAKQNPFRQNEPTAIPADIVTDIDEAETAAATADADMWRARYEAEKARRKAYED
jgi:hypothetical protein